MRTLFFALLFVTTIPGFTQNTPSSTSGIAIRKNAVYVEIMGTGILYSINYERLIPIHDQLALGARVGFSAHFIFVPVAEVNVLWMGPHHFLDTGVGFDFTDVATQSGGVSPTIHIGYRYQGKEGFFFRAFPMLISELDSDPGTGKIYFNMLYVGLSVGHCFGN